MKYHKSFLTVVHMTILMTWGAAGDFVVLKVEESAGHSLPPIPALKNCNKVTIRIHNVPQITY